MKAKIDKTGTLFFFRKKEYKTIAEAMTDSTGLKCMYCINDDSILCGDHCAGFSEPKRDGNMIVLELCCKTYKFHYSEFYDER